MNAPDPITRLNAALEGRYRIERELGEGGMATVYLAHDLKHERRVALKVLKPELAAVVGADRFLTEIKTTANLQHPHILPLHDSGEADGLLFYVMPYVDGESLRERLDREHQLPVDDAVRIATNMAEALDYAHRQGVIHRDIKPANVLLLDGKPVISDFGIALAVGAAGGGRLTETGLSLGTPHYMSPEQATGDQSVGATTDIYALGCVLYEMLVGEPPFTGSTAQAVLGKIITGEVPSARAGRASVAPNVDAVIHKALEKVPADRFRSAAQLKQALDDPAFRLKAGVDPRTGSESRRVSLALAAALVVVTGLAIWDRSRESDGAQAYRVVTLDLGDLTNPKEASLSPDGTAVLVVADGGLFLREFDEFSFRRMPNTEGAATAAWSPDGEWIAFGVGSEVRKMPRSGEPVSQVMRFEDRCADVCGVSWMEDGRIIAAGGQNDLWVASEDGGPATPLISRNDEHFHGSLALPGGAVLLYADRDVGGGQAQLWDGETRDPRPEIGVGGVRRPAYGAGFVFYQRGPDAWATRYSAADRALVGDPVFVASQLQVLSASEDGSLLGVALGSSAARDRELMWVGRDGEDLEVLASLPGGTGRIDSPALSRAGVLAYVVDGQLWTFDPRSRQRRPGPQANGTQRLPSWSPDGRYLYYNEADVGLDPWAGVLKRFDLVSGEVTAVVDGGTQSSPSADGRYLAYGVGDAGQQELRYLDLTVPDAEPGAFMHGFAQERSIQLSPAGEFAAFIAYDGTGTGGSLYVSRFPSGDDLVFIAAGASRFLVRWSADGTRLYYDRQGALVEVEVRQSPEGSIAPGEVVELFRFADRGINPAHLIVGPDNSRFLVGGGGPANPAGATLPHNLVLIQNWAPGR